MEIPPMKTGFSLTNDSNVSEGEHIGLVVLLLMVFSQNVMDNACEYCSHAGRDTVTPRDMIYALKYEAFNFCKRKSMMEYLDECKLEELDDDSEDDSEDEDEAEPSEADITFSEADSTINKFCKDVNEINEFWDNWTPTDEIEAILKKSVDASISEQLLADSNGGEANKEPEGNKKVQSDSI